jgi:ribosomal protein S18 acetylase RimI-like enzyme
MNIQLRPMQADEFDDYLAYFIPDYAAEISANYDLDSAAARARAEREAAADLGEGVETEGQVLLCIAKADDPDMAPIGYLWCKPDADAGIVFISDFYVFPEQRGMGVARGALAALERWFADLGHQELRLRVAADNARAQKVYQAAGYRVTGINMRKAIGTG